MNFSDLIRISVKSFTIQLNPIPKFHHGLVAVKTDVLLNKNKKQEFVMS